MYSPRGPEPSDNFTFYIWLLVAAKHQCIVPPEFFLTPTSREEELNYREHWERKRPLDSNSHQVPYAVVIQTRRKQMEKVWWTEQKACPNHPCSLKRKRMMLYTWWWNSVDQKTAAVRALLFCFVFVFAFCFCFLGEGGWNFEDLFTYFFLIKLFRM